jgi:hypothetical protein
MRRFPALLLGLFLPMITGAQDRTFVRSLQHVDLNTPDAVKTLAIQNPSHYNTIRAILAGLRGRPAASAEVWMHASFDAQDVRYGDFYRTSYPPKKDIAFTLGATRYYGRLTLHSSGAEFVPIRP